jgi:hypothetical protein
MHNIYGIENIPNVESKFLKDIKYFTENKYNINLYKGEIQEFLKKCIELKIKQTKEKETILNIFAINLETKISSNYKEPVNVNIGNLNTEGL